MRMTKKGFEIRQTYFYDAPPEKVFAALTEPNQLVRWFLSKAKVNLRKGGKIEFTWAGGHKMVGKVKRIVAGREVEYTWHDDLGKGNEAKTLVQFKVLKKGSGSILKLKHSGFGESRTWIELYGAIQSGWAYYLTNLKSVIQSERDLRSENDWI